MITAHTRVSDALAERPDLRQRLPAFHPAFAKLNHPVIGKILPKLVTVAEAARVAGVDVDALVAFMNLQSGATAHPPPSAPRQSDAQPAWVEPARDVRFDARPVLAGGADPFTAIVGAARELPDGAQLTVIAPFDPAPLVGYFVRQGWMAWRRWDGDACLVTFARGSSSVAPGPGPGLPDAEQGPDGWTLDVRDLSPPGPMQAVLAALDAGHLPLLVHHSREPAMLYPKLADRGLRWTVDARDDGVWMQIVGK